MHHLAPPASSKHAVLLQLHHADWYACQFQVAEWACTCKGCAYLQSCFELPSALLIVSGIALAGVADDT